jgi:hypothetical protein
MGLHTTRITLHQRYNVPILGTLTTYSLFALNVVTLRQAKREAPQGVGITLMMMRVQYKILDAYNMIIILDSKDIIRVGHECCVMISFDTLNRIMQEPTLECSGRSTLRDVIDMIQANEAKQTGQPPGG